MFGPALPPGFQRRPKTSEQPKIHRNDSKNTNADSTPSSSDEEDDGYGPSLPMAPELAEKIVYQQTLADIDARATKHLRDKDNGDKKLVREDWMLVPPKSKTIAEAVGNTMKARGFSKGSSAPQASAGPSAVWTESPQERLERLGRLQSEPKEKRKRSDEDHVEGRKLTKAELATKEFVERHNAQTRGVSLMEAYSTSDSHKERMAEENTKKFDWERDMKGNRVGHKKTQQMVQDAKRLDSRFSHGSKTYL